MKRYDSYKDSGVEWIGEIPSHWGSGEMKYKLKNNDGGVWGDDCEVEGECTIVIRSTEITIDGEWDLSNPMKRKLSDSEIQKTLLIEGDIVLTKSSGSPEHIGKSVIVNSEVEELRCCYSNFVQRLRFDKYNPKLYHYILNNYVVREQYRYLTQSTTGLGNLNGTTLNEVQLPFIPLSEQQQIVSYLDAKTSLIDSLIEKTQRKIELLKEKRTALINEVVTKGLNPNVEMKDSGVEWIGEIPSHWEKTKLKYQFEISGGGTPSKDNSEYWNGDIPWVSPKDMKVKYVSKTKDYVTNEGINNSSTKLISQKSLLMVVRSGILQHTIPVCFNSVPVTINQDLKSFEEKGQMSCSYLYHLIKGHEKNLLLEWSKEGATVESIEMDFMVNSELPLPSILEQQQIVEYLDEQTQLIDKTISIEERRIELLKEYRQSLISEVVTGKVDVRSEEGDIN